MSVQCRDEIGGVLAESMPRELRVESANLSRYGLDERGLAGEVGVERLLAHAEFGGEIVHGDAAEAVSEEVPPSAGDDPCPDGRHGRCRIRLLAGSKHRSPPREPDS